MNTAQKKSAFLFCGQGQMRPGILRELVLANPRFLRRFQELDAIAATQDLRDVSDYILAPENLVPTPGSPHAMLSLLTLQISMFEELIRSGRTPDFISGHSLGEFSQIVASGAVEFDEMIEFLIFRQRCLSEIEGRFVMFAVNDAEKMLKLDTDLEFHAANVNTDRQTAFVCRADDFERLKKLMRALKIASLQIDVDHPFHTPWLEPARVKLARELTARPLKSRAPRFAFLSSVTGEVVDRKSYSSEKLTRILVDQAVTPVTFPRQVARLHELGVENFMEIGPDEMLSPFVEQVLGRRNLPFKTSSYLT